MSGGDCFPVAANVLVEELADDPTAVLVHGRPLGTGGEAAGRRYWHAWVERTLTVQGPGWPAPITIVEIIDRSNGGDRLIPPREAYYKIGRIETTYRYTRDEAIARMLDTENYGPWEDE